MKIQLKVKNSFYFSHNSCHIYMDQLQYKLGYINTVEIVACLFG